VGLKVRSVEEKEGKVGSERSEQAAKKRSAAVTAVGTNFCTDIRRIVGEAVIREVVVLTEHLF
jgi:hypothetical protein